jgi:hypothetical protein
MNVTSQMIGAARRAEFDYCPGKQLIESGRFIPTPDDVIRAMPTAALATVPDAPAAVRPSEPQSAGPSPIVTTRPRRKR